MKATAKHYRLLEAIPIDGIDHLGRPLAEHLIGTHDLLSAWGSAEHVCLAGLLHAVYGTKTFRAAALTTGARMEVRQLIGRRAESLVYAFGMSDRKRLLLENRSAPFRWFDFRTGMETPIPGSVLSELVTMEAANFAEQIPCLGDSVHRVMPDMQHRFEVAREWLPRAAIDALREVFPGRPAEARAVRA